MGNIIYNMSSSTTNQPYRCETCGGMIFKNEEELQQHNLQEHIGETAFSGYYREKTKYTRRKYLIFIL
jgi:hypothetical protein